MPRIPDVAALGAQPDIAPQQWAPPPDNSAVPRALGSLAAGVSAISEGYTQQEAEKQFENFRTQVDQWELDNLHNPETGIQQFKGADAKALPGKVQEDYGTFLNESLKGMSNPRARDAAQKLGMARRFSILQTVNGYTTQQMQAADANDYEAGQVTKQQLTATLAAGLSDPTQAPVALTQVKTKLDAMNNDAYRYWRRQGQSDAYASMKASDAVAQAHGFVLANLLASGKDSDVMAARDYLAEFKSDPHMAVGTLLEAQKQINEKSTDIDVRDHVNAWAQQGVQAEHPDMGTQLYNLVANRESSGTHYGPGGTPLRSPKGAIGQMQVLESTGPEAAALAGVPWDKELFNHVRDGTANDQQAVNYNRALGVAYLDKQIKTFGSLDMGLAAYNAGPGAVDKAIQETKGQSDVTAEDGTVRPAWLAKLPQETQSYVDGITKGLQTGAAIPKTTRRATLAELDAQAMARYGNNSVALAKAQAQSRVVYEMQKKAEADAESEARSDVNKALVASRGVFTPQISARFQQMNGDAQQGVISFSKSLRDNAEMPNNDALFGELIGNPTKLAVIDPVAYRDQFDKAHFDKLVDKKAAIADATSPVFTNEQIVDGILETALQKKRSDIKPDVIGQFQSRLLDVVGPRAKPEDMRAAAQLLVQKVSIEHALWWDSEKPAFQVEPTDVIDPKKSPVFDSAPKATNPKTGKRVVLVNGQWVPYGR